MKAHNSSFGNPFTPFMRSIILPLIYISRNSSHCNLILYHSLVNIYAVNKQKRQIHILFTLSILLHVFSSYICTLHIQYPINVITNFVNGCNQKYLPIRLANSELLLLRVFWTMVQVQSRFLQLCLKEKIMRLTIMILSLQREI